MGGHSSDHKAIQLSVLHEKQIGKYDNVVKNQAIREI